MSAAMKSLDATVMRSCYNCVVAMFADHRVDSDVAANWWKCSNGSLDGDAPQDALLDGKASEVYRAAEDFVGLLKAVR